MMSNRQKESTVRDDRRGNRLTTTALAFAGTIALAIVAFANAGQVGADTRWAGDSGFEAPYLTEVAEGCGSVALAGSLGGSSYESAPQDRVPERVTEVGCFLEYLFDWRTMFDSQNL